jgi:hypothetical protein
MLLNSDFLIQRFQTCGQPKLSSNVLAGFPGAIFADLAPGLHWGVTFPG